MAEKKEKQVEKKPNFFVKLGRSIVKLFKDVKSEIKKIVWPTPKQTVNNTVIVIVAVLAVGAFVGILDLIFTSLLGVIIPMP